MPLQINDADPAIENVAQLRTLLPRLSAEIVDLDDRCPVTVTIISDPDYTLLAELAIRDTPVAVIPVYNFDDYVPMLEDHSLL